MSINTILFRVLRKFLLSYAKRIDKNKLLLRSHEKALKIAFQSSQVSLAYRTLLLEIVDHIGVVNNLVAHVDRCAEFLQCPLDNLDRTVHASAKAARLGQDDFGQHTFGRLNHSTPIN